MILSSIGGGHWNFVGIDVHLDLGKQAVPQTHDLGEANFVRSIFWTSTPAHELNDDDGPICDHAFWRHLFVRQMAEEFPYVSDHLLRSTGVSTYGTPVGDVRLVQRRHSGGVFPIESIDQPIDEGASVNTRSQCRSPGGRPLDSIRSEGVTVV